jgi:Putative DNA-binding domain
MNAATDLVSLQRAFQELILKSAPDARGIIRSDDPADGAKRLSIYSSAYRLRLEEALAANFPMLHTHLGDEMFSAVACRYLDAHPSSYKSIRTFGVHLPQWLENNRAQEPWLADFARLEWSLGTAFDAPDSLAIGIESLAGISPQDWSVLTFRFAPATQRLTLQTNAASLYAAAANEESARTASPERCRSGHVLPHACEWLVWRRSMQAQYRSLTLAESVAIATLLAGRTFGDVCERLAEFEDDASVPRQAASFLKRWLIDELIVGHTTLSD